MIECAQIKFTAHAIRRMFESGISYEEVMEVIKKGEVIEEYADDKPYPTYLLLAFVGERALHVVIAKEENQRICYIVTVYVPDPSMWEEGFRKRRR